LREHSRVSPSTTFGIKIFSGSSLNFLLFTPQKAHERPLTKRNPKGEGTEVCPTPNPAKEGIKLRNVFSSSLGSPNPSWFRTVRKFLVGDIGPTVQRCRIDSTWVQKPIVETAWFPGDSVLTC
jgi:hypothetical protein